MLGRVAALFAGRGLERLLPLPRSLPGVVANRFASAALPRLVERLGPARLLGGIIATSVVQHLAAHDQNHDREESDR